MSLATMTTIGLGTRGTREDIAARKFVTGQEYWQGSVSQDLFPLEANPAGHNN